MQASISPLSCSQLTLCSLQTALPCQPFCPKPRTREALHPDLHPQRQASCYLTAPAAPQSSYLDTPSFQGSVLSNLIASLFSSLPFKLFSRILDILCGHINVHFCKFLRSKNGLSSEYISPLRKACVPCSRPGRENVCPEPRRTHTSTGVPRLCSVRSSSVLRVGEYS